VEVNHTVSSLPQVSTTERSRREADGVNRDFVFTVTAWQALTRPIASPTWRGNDDDLSEAEREAVGMLQPNHAWRRAKERTAALDADVVLLQTPPSCNCTDEHAATLRRFVDAVGREGLTLAWEPRGDEYDYDDDELGELAEHHERVYCLFSNYEMETSARRLADHLD
jgi:uncharacterized protein YecE (DUF72 family)